MTKETEELSDLIWRAGRGPGGDAPPTGLEWLVTNGLGGYAAGTVAGVPTRRYHGLLVSALPNPLGRVVMFNHVREELELADGSSLRTGVGSGAEGGGLREFRLDHGLPVWRYGCGASTLERRVIMPHRRNTVHLTYCLTEGEAGGRLRIRPALHWRQQEAPVSHEEDLGYAIHWSPGRLEITGSSPFPPLRIWISAVDARFTLDETTWDQVMYPVEEERGYAHSGTLWSPGYYDVGLQAGSEVTLVASTEDWPVVLAVSPGEVVTAERARRRQLLARAGSAGAPGPGSRLVLAADAFTVAPGYRLHEVERARYAGRNLCTVIAGYYWFTDWGRDTMISLEGLTLCTRRYDDARGILRTFGSYVRDGLVPNMFPVGSSEGIYNTADATLWFFHALARYLEYTGDDALLDELLPVLVDIVDHHLAGTEFGIGVDPADHLLREGTPELPLTWMDARYDDVVVTPRRGKPVEINALWYNALRLMERWSRRDPHAAGRGYADLAQEVEDSFNRRFWYEEGGFLYDVVDGEEGDDASFRPNQIFALSLPFPVLRPERWTPVIEAVRERLLTPFGLRSLAPGEPGYHASYHGDRRSRDSAYHQGTVWPWLIGPFIDAWLRVHPTDQRTASAFLAGLIGHLEDFGLGSIAEVFDAEPPYNPRGCIAQAWSVAEVLRTRLGLE